jgi:hypothetical protein
MAKPKPASKPKAVAGNKKQNTKTTVQGYTTDSKNSLTDIKESQQGLLGPDYPYWKNIKSPQQLGMSDKGTLEVMNKDINGLISYVEILVSGKSKASATGKPLGNKFFYNTGASCLDNNTKKEVDRYIYINNVPKGNIPFVSYGMGANFKEFKGLIPGTLSSLNTLNPLTVMQGFMEGSLPSCKTVTLETIDTQNKKSKETHYITVSDLNIMDPCDFPNKINPETKQKCKEVFTNMNDATSINNNNDLYYLPKDPIVQLYFACLGLLSIYVMYRIIQKTE